MSRDFKSRANPPRRKKNPQAPGWVWFSAGLLVGVFFSGLAWLKLTPSQPLFPQQSVTAKQTQPKKPAPTKKQKQQGADTPKPRFDFYTILPEMEVVVPEPTPEPKTGSGGATHPKTALIKPGGVGSYMLQMGSFRSYADADRLKASLALVGIQAEIQRVKIKSGDVYHRVRSGPYDRLQVNRLRAKLKEHKISSLVIKYRN